MFQKQSPFLDDMNSIIHIAKQIGLIHQSYYSYLPNATKCNTIADVFKSHRRDKVIVEMNDIYGMLVLLGLGMGLALITFTAESILLV